MKKRCAVALVVLLVTVGLAYAGGVQDKEGGEATTPEVAGDSGGEIISYATVSEYQKETGARIEGFHEAPQLAALVNEGKLPPVEERLPVDPLVVKSLDSIGKYGGDLRVGSQGPAMGFDSGPARAQHLLKYGFDLQTVKANIAKGWDFDADYKTLTIYLREGLKWSDGAPFTADDIMFWYEDIILNDELTPGKPKRFSPGGQLMKVSKTGQYAVRIEMATAYPAILSIIALGEGGDIFAPKHYLQKYHVK